MLLVALARIGAVQNPLIPILREREVSFITRQVGTELLIVPEEWRGFPHGAMARELAATGGFDVMEIDLHELGARGSREGLRLPTADPDSSARPPSPSIDGPRWIYYSSGTTADPKGARHTDASIMASANALLELMGFGENDVYPIPWPITHIGGASVLAASLRGGVHLVLFETFDPADDARPDGSLRADGAGHRCPVLPGLPGRSRASQRSATLSRPAVRMFRRCPRPHRDPRRDAGDVRRAPRRQLGPHRVPQRHVCGTD